MCLFNLNSLFNGSFPAGIGGSLHTRWTGICGSSSRKDLFRRQNALGENQQTIMRRRKCGMLMQLLPATAQKPPREERPTEPELKRTLATLMGAVT